MGFPDIGTALLVRNTEKIPLKSGILPIDGTIMVLYLGVTNPEKPKKKSMKATHQFQQTPSVANTVFKLTVLGSLTLGTCYVLAMMMGMLMRAI